MPYQDVSATQVVDLSHQVLREEVSTGKLAIAKLSTRRSRDWVRRVLSLLEEAVRQLQPGQEVAHGTLLEATLLLRKHFDLEGRQELPDGKGRLLPWQARRVLDYIDSNIAGSVLVADLCALIHRSQAHFSRSFKRTFGESPRAFVIRSRLELAARHMLQTDTSLSDIALQCGFTDQAHLCKHFRQSTGQTPAAWRRARRMQNAANSVASSASEGMLSRSVRSNARQARQC